jgi:hypothetical protein
MCERASERERALATFLFILCSRLNNVFTTHLISSSLLSLSLPSRTGGSNLMGKFTQSVRRIVQDVKDEGTMSGLGREEVIDINERLILFRVRLEASYETAKQALNALITKYGDSKSQRNIFHRYPMLKVMIKVRRRHIRSQPLEHPQCSLIQNSSLC